MVIDGFRQRVLATPAINNALEGRIFEDTLPRGYRLPAAVIHTYEGTEENDMAGTIGTREDGVQIDVYAAKSEDARAIVEAVRDTFKNFTGALPDGTVVMLVQVQRAMALPFLNNADPTNNTRRHMIGFHVVSKTS